MQTSPAPMQQCPEELVRRARIIATWADRMPLRDVYIFGDHKAANIAKLKIAIEYSGEAGEETMSRWQQANSSDFAELQAALGVRISLFTDQDLGIWAPIRSAARMPLLAIGKVKVVHTPLL
jgi:hypothetical protein